MRATVSDDLEERIGGPESQKPLTAGQPAGYAGEGLEPHLSNRHGFQIVTAPLQNSNQNPGYRMAAYKCPPARE
jgi:hypothetical protein